MHPSGRLYIMNFMGHDYFDYGFPFFGWGMMLIWIVVFLVIGYFVYLDANKRGMNGILWWILIIIPVIGIFALILYIILRETGGQKNLSEGKIPLDILKERYAKGEITTEQFQKMTEELKNATRESIWEEQDSSNAMDILNERYAKGELTSEQFRTMNDYLKKVLEENIWENADPDSSNAMNILKERYAKGELNNEQFRIMLADLKK